MALFFYGGVVIRYVLPVCERRHFSHNGSMARHVYT